ncbi:MFS transporter [Asticcacaulis sp. YBE204]|uniref:MFS transporter n=1 Tax=Asticcacaulis sp. YBE204 TaxID=1282363 RepID=UPI0003C3D21D|nr:MFS transporter [Asticcacaulis sp. YBE204]ESQ80110.1 multidrug transporter [Asticcacaulis sp. YBE204]
MSVTQPQPHTPEPDAETSDTEPAPKTIKAKKTSIKSAIQDNSALSVMFGVVFINLVGFGLLVPLLPFFAQQLQADAWQVTLMFAAYSLGQFFAEPLWGSLSDKWGRKPVMVITVASNVLFYILLAFSPNIWWAILIRFFNGIGSGNVSCIQSYVSDMSEPHQRASRMSLIGAAFSLGFVVGPVIGGVLVHEDAGMAGFQLPLFVAAGLSAVATLGVLFFVKESRQRTRTMAPPEKFRETFAQARRNPVISRVILATLCYMAAFAGLEATFGLWAKARYNWHAHEISLIFLFIGVTAALMQMVLTRPLVRRYGEARVLAMGLIVFGLGFLLQGINRLPFLITPLVMFATLGQAVIFASISALISKATPPDRQGAMLGLNMATGATARIAGPVIAGFLFSLIGPDGPLWFGALMCFPAALLALKVEKVERRLAADTE